MGCVVEGRGEWRVEVEGSGRWRGVEGAWAVGTCTTYHPFHAISGKRLGRLSTNLVCRVTDPRQMLCTSQIRIATTHVHNIFLLYLGKFLVY